MPCDPTALAGSGIVGYVMPDLGYFFFVTDGQKRETGDTLITLQNFYQQVVLVSHLKNKGRGKDKPAKIECGTSSFGSVSAQEAVRWHLSWVLRGIDRWVGGDDKILRGLSGSPWHQILWAWPPRPRILACAESLLGLLKLVFASLGDYGVDGRTRVAFSTLFSS